MGVLLVGGSPLSGKSTVARHLAQRIGAPLVSTDLLAEAARAVTTSTSHADLHAASVGDYVDYYASRSVEELCADALRAHDAVWPAISAVIRRRVSWEGPAVIEGWALLPGRVAQLKSAAVMSVWIGAPASVLIDRLRLDTAFCSRADDPQLLIDRFVGRSVRLNHWLREAARLHGMPYLDVLPDETAAMLALRCWMALHGDKADPSARSVACDGGL